MKELDLSCFIFNPYQEKEFTLYDLVIYYSFVQTTQGEYTEGYRQFSKLFKNQMPYLVFRRGMAFKQEIKKFKKELAFHDPVVVNRDFSIWAEGKKVALALYYGVKKVPITLTKKNPQVKYNDAWLIENYSPEEAIEIQRQKEVFLNAAKTLVS